MGRDGLFIGEVATNAGVSRKALRVYEAAGILHPAAALPNNGPLPPNSVACPRIR